MSAPAGPLPEVVPRALLVAGTPHLFAGVRETTGVVGPLVVPGRSSCLRCADLNRTARDPAWPTLAAQLATPAGPIVDALDGALAAAVAAHAALQVLGLLDGLPAPGTAAADTAPAAALRSSRPPPTLDGTLELTLPDWRWRRRSWPPHPECDCQALAG